MIEGGSSDTWTLVKTMLYNRPELLHHILNVNAQAVTATSQCADRSRRAGGCRFSIPGAACRIAPITSFRRAIEQIIQGLEREHNGQKVPVIVFTKGRRLVAGTIAA